jgi:sarcosine oxidase subunit delta
MSFLLSCPNCGKRNVSEFSYRGEYKSRPDQGAPFDAWVDYVYMKSNERGTQTEWWYHRSGCRRWFLVERDTTCNTDHRSYWFDDREK